MRSFDGKFEARRHSAPQPDEVAQDLLAELLREPFTDIGLQIESSDPKLGPQSAEMRRVASLVASKFGPLYLRKTPVSSSAVLNLLGRPATESWATPTSSPLGS